MTALILALMLSLAPGRDHTQLADAIAQVVDESAPLFKGDESKQRTAAFLVSVAFRESSFRLNAIGDGGRARCAFQLWAAPAAVLDDAVMCTRIAMQRLRESARICGAGNVLGLYAAGPAGCSSEKARRISRDRLALAGRTLKAVQP